MQENKVMTAQAWLTQINSQWVSIGLFEVKMLLENPKIISIIGAPSLFSDLIAFKDNLIPLINFNNLLKDKPSKKIENNTIFGLIAYYNNTTKKAEYGAIQFDRVPQNISVNNEMQIDLELSESQLKNYSKSLFKYDEKTIHVLDINKLFNLKERKKNEKE